MPVHNGEKFLYESINSILSQSFKNFELIIVNDCSTDATIDIVKLFESKDMRIRIIDNKINYGLPKSLNIGHSIAKYDLFTWTSDDNIVSPDWLLNLYSAIIDSSDFVVFSDYTIINSKGDISHIQNTGPVSDLLIRSCIGANFLYSRSVFEKLKGYNINLFGIEDFDFWRRAFVKGINFIHLNNTSDYFYRMHEGSLTSRKKTHIINLHISYIIRNSYGLESKFKKNHFIYLYALIKDNFKLIKFSVFFNMFAFIISILYSKLFKSN